MFDDLRGVCRVHQKTVFSTHEKKTHIVLVLKKKTRQQRREDIFVEKMPNETTKLLSHSKSGDSIKSDDEIFAETHGMENNKKVFL